jgi:hypothetical protein
MLTTYMLARITKDERKNMERREAQNLDSLPSI